MCSVEFLKLIYADAIASAKMLLAYLKFLVVIPAFQPTDSLDSPNVEDENPRFDLLSLNSWIMPRREGEEKTHLVSSRLL